MLTAKAIDGASSQVFHPRVSQTVVNGIYEIQMRRTLVSFSYLALIFILSSCGDPEWVKEITKARDETKRLHTPAEVQQAMVPFFENNSNLTNKLPAEIASLPIFFNSDYIVTDTIGTNALMIMTGSGFGHWGLIVVRPGQPEDLGKWHQERIIPWGEGVYFFSEYRWAK